MLCSKDDQLICLSIWGIADGSRNIDVNAEIVAYAILDVLAKPVFGFWLLFTHDSMSKYVDSYIKMTASLLTILAARSRSKGFGLMDLARRAPSAWAMMTKARKCIQSNAPFSHDPTHMAPTRNTLHGSYNCCILLLWG